MTTSPSTPRLLASVALMPRVCLGPVAVVPACPGTAGAADTDGAMLGAVGDADKTGAVDVDALDVGVVEVGALDVGLVDAWVVGLDDGEVVTTADDTSGATVPPGATAAARASMIGTS
jgi:hypothetical protein